MSILFILNPMAGTVRPEITAALIKSVIEPAGVHYSIEMTTAPGVATSAAKRAKVSGFDTVCAVGGDGTIQEVAQGVMGTGAALGFVPTGNGNDFARIHSAHFGITPPKEPENRIRWYARRLIAAKSQSIDAIKSGSFLSLNIAGVGLDSEIARDGAILKPRFGKMSYIASTIKNSFTYKPFDGRVVCDGEVSEGRFAFVSACNGRYYGGGFNIAPRAELNDGLLDVVIVRAMPGVKVLALFPTVLFGRHEGIKQVSIRRCKRVDIAFDGDRFVNYDGNIILLKSPLSFEIAPSAIEIF